MKSMTIIFMFFLLSFSSLTYAGAWSSWATPTRVDIERGGGFMVYGSFGNPNGCTVDNRFYVKKEHPQYKEIYSAVLAAFSSGKRVQAHIRDCEGVSWYAILTTTFNVLKSSGSLNIQN